MGKKTGRKASYIVYCDSEVKDLINSKEVGLSFDRTTQSYYTMLPTSEGTKRKWLSKDIEKAVATFYALMREIKGEQEKFVDTETEIFTSFPEGSFDAGILDYMNEPINFEVSEKQYIQWLKKEIQNPKELARKTGIEAFSRLSELLAKDESILLSDLLENYLNKKKVVSEVEAYNSKLFFNEFVEVIDCQTVEEILLSHIHTYEDYLHSKSLSPKSIINRMSKIGTVIKYNCGRYNNSHLIQIYNWLRGLDRPENDRPFNPKIMSLHNFNLLYEASKTKWKLMFLMGINCAMTPIDFERLKKENINFAEGTVSFRRGKTGKVLAVSSLWSRTRKLLEKHLSERKGDSEYIFASCQGSPIRSRSISSLFNKLREKLKIDDSVKFNHLRDTFSTISQDLGFPLERINLVMGHKNKGMQDHYAVRNCNKLTQEMCKAVEQEFFKMK